ncbi:hypothetical protein CXF85_08670 [Colwellia sp. 75C3]|uniref:hypothetical protein n=1 Tax=Colwellia sp. 75C3 TaxID=888425 RepID=UPI000C34B7EE|nr:hypothetical protein [Colwellia sp. 75C3]PKG84384.1 hypothetical protein CXF85_08670 [Colwellia sp. 75C3]
MKTIKPAHLKRVIDFIHSIDDQYCGKELRYFFNNDLNKFIQLLHEAVRSAEVVPSVVIPFYRKVSKMHDVKPSVTIEEETMKSSNQSNQSNPEKKASFVFRIVTVVKSAYESMKAFLTRNMKKASVVAAVVIAVTIAKAVGLNIGFILALAALKGKAVMSYFSSLCANAVELIIKAKSFAIDNADGIFALIKATGHLLLSKVIEVKDLVVTKVKQAISWIKDAVTIDEHEYAQAA